jgi:K+ transporter
MDNATAHHSSAAKLTAQPVSHRSSEFIALTLGGIGVVYGDIGTSPLYAFREAAIAAAHNAPLTRGGASAVRHLANVVGAGATVAGISVSA